MQTWFSGSQSVAQRLPALVACHIRGYRDAFAILAEISGGGLTGICLARGNIDPGARLQQALADHVTDPPGTAGYQGHLALESEQALDIKAVG